MGVRFLVDTHVVLWLMADPDRVDKDVRASLAEMSNDLLVSSASGLEIATKIRLGKLEAADLPTTLPRRLERMGATVLPISIEHALLAGSLAWSHRDPFDRLLVAQATIEDATLVTVDRALVNLPVPRILTW